MHVRVFNDDANRIVGHRPSKNINWVLNVLQNVLLVISSIRRITPDMGTSYFEFFYSVL